MIDSNKSGNSDNEVGAELEAVLRRMSAGEDNGIASFYSLLKRHPDSTETMGHLA